MKNLLAYLAGGLMLVGLVGVLVSDSSVWVMAAGIVCGMVSM